MSWNFCVPTVTLFQSVSCNFHSCSWSVAESTLLVAMCLLPSHDHLLWVGMSEAFFIFTTASGDSDQEWTKAGFGDWICHWRWSSSEKNNRKVCTLVDLKPWPTLIYGGWKSLGMRGRPITVYIVNKTGLHFSILSLPLGRLLITGTYELLQSPANQLCRLHVSWS